MDLNDVKVEDDGLSSSVSPVSPDERMGYTYRFALAQSLGASDLVRMERVTRSGVLMAQNLHRQFFDWLYDQCCAYSREVEIRVKNGCVVWCKPDVVVFFERDGEVVVRQLIAGPDQAALEERVEFLKVGMPSYLPDWV